MRRKNNNMKTQEELAGYIKEVSQQATSEAVARFEARAAAQEEEIAKLKETNVEWKAKMDALQDKEFKASGKFGEATYKFKGYDTTFNRNFKACLTEADADTIAKYILDRAHGKSIDFSGVMPTFFGSTIMGLAELKSSALANFNVFQTPMPIVKLPVKAVREVSNSQPSVQRTPLLLSQLVRLPGQLMRELVATQKLEMTSLRTHHLIW